MNKKGWRREPARHSLAARGVGTRRSTPHKSIRKERLDWSKDEQTKVKENIDRLEEIKYEMKELIEESRRLIRDSTDDDIVYERARSYWIAHIEGALDEDNEWLGGSMTRMQDTIDELTEILEEAKHGPEEE